MKISITAKLFLAIVTAASLAVISMVLVMQWNLSRGFLRFVNMTEKTSVSRLAGRLEEGYRDKRNWDFVRHDPERWRQLVISSLPEQGPLPREEREPPPGPERHEAGGSPPRRAFPPFVVRQFAQRVFLLDAAKMPLVAQAAVHAGADTTPLRYEGKTVAYLGLLPRTNLSDDHQKRFLREQKSALVLVAGVIVLLSAGLSLLLAKRLVLPIADLAKATDRLTQGDFAIRVPVGSTDELGRLAHDFNSLALVLARNEEARKQWMADISHELRTPLAVLRGEIEALQDGIRHPTPETIRSLHSEVLRLGRLVDDLYQLSLSDLGALTYRKTEVDIAGLVSDAVASYRQEAVSKVISISESISLEDSMILGDPERLHQLFGNILSNALKYTNPGGTIEICLSSSSGTVLIDFQDSPPGVSPEELEKLFDRLYRVEASRSRATGGAGLGLAICRSILDAHGGTIGARRSPLGGVWIHIELPVVGVPR